MEDQAELLLCAVGDMNPNRKDPESITALAAPVLKKADFVIGQLETAFSTRGHTDPSNVKALTGAGINVMSCASNMALTWGEEAFSDSLEVLRQNGIMPIGGGKNLEEARKPAILERKGTRIAFLAYCSVLPKGFEATERKAGCVPIRAATSYEIVDAQPGAPPRVATVANKEDVEAMRNDIAKAKAAADLVVVSMHWGIHFLPGVVAMYQREVARAAIDAGAELILGHHAHILKGIEVYKGKAIFYSLCNFAMDANYASAMRNNWWAMYNFDLDPEYPTYPYPADSRKTIVARCVISGRKIASVGFLPVMINKTSQPEILARSDKRSSEVLEYIQWCCRNQRFDTQFAWDGDQVLVKTQKE